MCVCVCVSGRMYHRLGNLHIKNNLRENFSWCYIFVVSFDLRNFFLWLMVTIGFVC